MKAPTDLKRCGRGLEPDGPKLAARCIHDLPIDEPCKRCERECYGKRKA